MRRQLQPKIWKRQTSLGQYTYYVDFGKINGKRVRIRCQDHAEAVKIKSEGYKQRKNNGNKTVFELGKAAHSEVTYYLSRLEEFGATLSEAVEFFIKHSKPEKPQLTISESVSLWVDQKKSIGNRELSVTKTAGSYYAPFSAHFGKDRLIGDITASDIEKYLKLNKDWSPYTYNNHVRNLSALYRFIIKRGHWTLNPLAKIESQKIQDSPIKWLLPSEVDTALQYCLQHGLHYQMAIIILVAFCGVRIEEVDKLEWSDISFERRIIEITARIAKKSKRRVNDISLNALFWLKKIPSHTGKIVPVSYEGRKSSMRRLWKILKEKHKIKYTQNALRHCFATYHLAKHGSYEKTAQLLGHPNGQQLYANYRELTTKDKAEIFWRIIPNGLMEELKEEKRRELIAKLYQRKAKEMTEDSPYGVFEVHEESLQLWGYGEADEEGYANQELIEDCSSILENFDIFAE
jgi:integrase